MLDQIVQDIAVLSDRSPEFRSGDAKSVDVLKSVVREPSPEQTAFVLHSQHEPKRFSRTKLLLRSTDFQHA